MIRRGAALVAALAALAAGPAPAASPPAGALACAGCHGRGAGPDSPPPIHGRPAADIARLVEAYRSGAAAGTVMPRLARGFEPGEIAAIADWLAAQALR
jgi:cytochrome c553